MHLKLSELSLIGNSNNDPCDFGKNVSGMRDKGLVSGVPVVHTPTIQLPVPGEDGGRMRERFERRVRVGLVG